MTPTISTQRLMLQPLLKATKRNAEWLSNKVVVQFSEQRHAVHTVNSCQRYINSFVDGSHIWGLYLVETGQHIGNLTSRFDRSNNVAELGMLIGYPEMWGKGYGREAWLAASEWLLKEQEVRKLEAGCMASNAGMRRVLENTGFELEGERRLHFLHNGPVGLVQYARFR